MRTNRKLFILIVAVLVVFIAQAQPKQPEKSMDEMWGEAKIAKQTQNTDKTKLFDNGNFGMFIHFGLFSHLGGKWMDKTYYGIAEWIMNDKMANIPVDKYKEVAKQFNPKYFNAKDIVKLAKDAGMKYIIITSKHHDGFAMFHTKVDSFNIVDYSPYGKDPMKELSDECRSQGLGFGFYYSHNQDWTTPGGTRGPVTYPNGKPASFDDYFYKKCLPQVSEICSNYGQIDFVWFDTPGDMKKKYVEELVAVVEKLQPKAMLCSRVGFGYGDYVSQGDMEVPMRNMPGLWETCDTNNDSWSYTWYDNNYKSSKQLLNRLVSTVSRGGTYLLNVGPDGNGVVPETGAKFLIEVGKWIRNYPQVIYSAGPSPCMHAQPWGDITTNSNSMYLTIFDWPNDGKLSLFGLKNKIETAYLLNGSASQEIKFNQSADWAVFEVPYKPVDAPASVIELRFANNTKAFIADTIHALLDNYDLNLSVEFASVYHAEKKNIRWMEKFGEWKHANQVSAWENDGKVVWKINVQKEGKYTISLGYKGEDKLVWNITTDEGSVLQNQQAATIKYQQYPMGIIEFKKAGYHTISVSLVEGDHKSSSLESIKINIVN